jgi:hypothetical protein
MDRPRPWPAQLSGVVVALVAHEDDHPAVGRRSRFVDPPMLREGSETGLDSSLGLVEEGREVHPAQGGVASRIGLASALSKAAEDQLVEFVVVHSAGEL